jgi:hypothetical protein
MPKQYKEWGIENLRDRYEADIERRIGGKETERSDFSVFREDSAKEDVVGKSKHIMQAGVTKQTPWPLVRERTIPTDRPPLVSEI